jgi:hypothetical protein
MSVGTHPDVSIPGRLAEVADGVFAYTQSNGSWMINNAGFLVAWDGVTVVDACSTERRTRAFLDTVGGVTRRPVRTLVNTHHHPDHTGGNGLFARATIVAHDNAREEMRAMGVPRNTGIWTDIDYGDLRLALPFLTFADRLTLWADDLRCELPVTGPEVIDEVLGYLYFVKDVAERGHAAGLTPLDASRDTDLGRYADWTDTERIVGNLHRAYADLAGTVEQRGGPVDGLGALADMVAYNGGRPLTCLA